MAAEAFSSEWAKAVREAVNASPGFRRAGTRWNQAVVFVMTGDGRDRCVLLDLRGGQCVVARTARSTDRASAPLVIAADAATWRDLLEGRTDLLRAVMGGRFSMEQGSVAGLISHVGAARELIAAAAQVRASFE